MVIAGEFTPKPPPSYSLLQARLYDIPTFKNALSAYKAGTPEQSVAASARMRARLRLRSCLRLRRRSW